LNLEPSGSTWANADLSGSRFITAVLRYLPWRSLLMAVPLVLFLVRRGSPTALVLAVAAGAVALAVWERAGNRDFVTASSVVRQRGLLRRSRREIPLELVDEVRVHFSGVSGRLGCGDLEVVSRDACWTYVGVADAQEKAKRIMRARNAARRSRTES